MTGNTEYADLIERAEHLQSVKSSPHQFKTQLIAHNCFNRRLALGWNSTDLPPIVPFEVASVLPHCFKLHFFVFQTAY